MPIVINIARTSIPPACVYTLHKHYQRGPEGLPNEQRRGEMEPLTKPLVTQPCSNHFADAAALAAHSKEALQRLMCSFAQACRMFVLKISLKKTNILGQDVCSAPAFK